MKIALDLDNTIDAAPIQYASMMSAWKAAGHSVVVLTGTSGEPASLAVWQAKADYLQSLGCGACWTDLTVIASVDGDTADYKAEWCKENSVDVLIDNTKDNAKAAVSAGVPLVLVPWATRT